MVISQCSGKNTQSYQYIVCAKYVPLFSSHFGILTFLLSTTEGMNIIDEHLAKDLLDDLILRDPSSSPSYSPG